MLVQAVRLWKSSLAQNNLPDLILRLARAPLSMTKARSGRRAPRLNCAVDDADTQPLSNDQVEKCVTKWAEAAGVYEQYGLFGAKDVEDGHLPATQTKKER